jgi:hypothetical protein
MAECLLSGSECLSVAAPPSRQQRVRKSSESRLTDVAPTAQWEKQLCGQPRQCLAANAIYEFWLFRFLRGEPAHVTTIESRTLKFGLPA